jgi:DNA-binding XRE family transcriptional regulator
MWTFHKEVSMATQIIRGPDGRPAFAVLPWDEYRALAPDAADAALSDEELFDRAKAEGDETFPTEIADRLIAGDSPIKVFREYRSLSQAALAKAAGVHRMYISQLERGTRAGSTAMLIKLAGALGVELQDLVDQPAA